VSPGVTTPPANPADWIAALRTAHDRLAAFVGQAAPDDLTHPSMCTEWNVAQVLSHLGSGAEIFFAVVTETPVDNQEVWARWNAKPADDMAASFVPADERLVGWFEALSPDELTTRQVQLPFLPAPISAVEAAGFRLSEVALHSWDVFASFDSTVGVAAEATPLLLGRLPMMVGFVGRFTPRESRPAGDTTIAVRTADPDRRFELELGDHLDLRPAADGDVAGGELTLPAEALLRLAAGRLKTGREAGATVTGAVTLDDLRRAFPGY
jgi:uncharacterized protein (TIGR03083 family)